MLRDVRPSGNSDDAMFFFAGNLLSKFRRSALWLGICTVAGAANGQSPQLSFVEPASVRPGEANQLVLHGTNLKSATRLWTSLAAPVAASPSNSGQNASRVTFGVEVPAAAELGLFAVRVATSEGISNLKLLVCDDLPLMAERHNNQSPGAAQDITLPVAISGDCRAEAARYYKIRLKKDQRLATEVFARRIGSPLDPIIRLLGPDGRELAYSDDVPGLIGDAQFAIIAPADGEYLIEIRDIRFRGGAEYRFHLRLGDFPLVNCAFPLGVQRGQTSVLRLLGTESASPLTTSISVPADESRRVVQVAAKSQNGKDHAFAVVAVSGVNELLEAEVDNSTSPMQMLPTPGAISGTFFAAKDRDNYVLDVVAGQRVFLAGMTRRYGAPTDLSMRLYQPQGRLLAEAEDNGIDEGSMIVDIPASGKYRLEVEELHQRGGPQYAYRIEARIVPPDFLLSLAADCASPPQAGDWVVAVKAHRQGYQGPITLAVEGLGPSPVISDHIIPPDKDETRLRVTMPSSFVQGTTAILRVIGTGEIEGRPISAVARIETAARGADPMLPLLPLGLVDRVALGIGPVFPEFFSVALEPVNVLYPRLVGTSTVKVKAKREHKFNDTITLTIVGLPSGIKAQTSAIAKSKNEAAITFTGPKELALGTHKIRIQGEATYKDQRRKVAVGTKLRVIEPLQVFVTPAGAISVGGKQKSKVRVERFGQQKSEVSVKLKNLPTGVTAPATLTIPAGMDGVEFEFAASAKAPPGKSETLIAEATTTVLGHSITVESESVPLEVVASSEAKK